MIVGIQIEFLSHFFFIIEANICYRVIKVSRESHRYRH